MNYEFESHAEKTLKSLLAQIKKKKRKKNTLAFCI